MPKYRIGVLAHCPFDNVVVAGTNFPRLSGAPGKVQTEGLVIELDMAQVSAIKNEIDQREVRFFDDGRCAAVAKDENRKGGDIVRGPAVRKCVPLGKMIYIDKVAAPAVKKPAPKGK